MTEEEKTEEVLKEEMPIEDLRKEIMEEVYAEEGIESKPVEEKAEAKPEEVSEEKQETEETKSDKDKISDDPWAGVSPAIKDTLQNIDGRLKQSESRLGSLINKIHNAGKEAEKKGAETPTKEQIAESAKNEETWEELKEDFPDWAQAIEGKLAASSAKITGELPKIQEAIKQDIESFKNTLSFEFEKKIVSLHHPGWEKTVQSPNYITWLNTQAEDVKQKHFSDKSEDAIDLLNRFKEKNGHKKAGKASEIEKTAAAREERLKKSTTLKTTHKENAPKSELDMAPEELRKSIANQVWNE